MRAKVAVIVGLVALLVALPVAGCGEKEGEEAFEAVEGEPLHLGDLIYNVALTRFLNPDDTSDREYLVGQPPEPTGESYLGVFVLITNDNDDQSFEIADDFEVTDASGRTYEPLETESPYALELGATIAGDGRVPTPDTTAAAGPTQGALLLFLVDDDVSEERPLELAISDPEASGVVELDI